MHLNSIVACAGSVANSMPLFPSGEISPAFLTIPGQFILPERHSRRFVPAQRRSAPAQVVRQCSGQPCHILSRRIQQRLFRFFLSKLRRVGIDATTVNFRISGIHAGFGEKIDSRQTRGWKIRHSRQFLSGIRDPRQTRESPGITVQGQLCAGSNLRENRRMRSHIELAPTRRSAIVAGMAPVIVPSAADAAGFREISADGVQAAGSGFRAIRRRQASDWVPSAPRSPGTHRFGKTRTNWCCFRMATAVSIATTALRPRSSADKGFVVVAPQHDADYLIGGRKSAQALGHRYLE